MTKKHTKKLTLLVVIALVLLAVFTLSGFFYSCDSPYVNGGDNSTNSGGQNNSNDNSSNNNNKNAVDGYVILTVFLVTDQIIAENKFFDTPYTKTLNVPYGLYLFDLNITFANNFEFLGWYTVRRSGSSTIRYFKRPVYINPRIETDGSRIFAHVREVT